MPRTRRYIFNTLTVVSLLLWLATAGLGIGLLSLNTEVLGKGHRVLNLDKGVYIHLEGDMSEQLWSRAFGALKAETVHADVNLFVFHYSSSTRYGVKVTYVYFSLFPFIVLLLILPLVWALKWNKRRKLGPNACLGCGYDLTGNETGVCPECGAATPKLADA